ncbi:hypothetical protein BDQ17DRAFT_1392446 [Cyathus striatus]|nr:hypothetical protein BDQ17DRAFT_1392446 [Cyathus striatus]
MSSDEELLASLGYRQELKWDFSLLQLLGLGFSITSVSVYNVSSRCSCSVLVCCWSSMGGAMGIITFILLQWGTCSIFVMTIAFAMAKLASSAPTSGELYYWTFKYSSPCYHKVASWVVRYANSVGYITGVSGLDFALLVQTLAAVSIGTDGTYIPTSGQTFSVFCGLLLLHSLIASLATSTLAKIQPYSITLNTLLFVALLIVLPIATLSEFKNSAPFAFGNFKNLSLWPSGFAFMLSWLALAWTMALGCMLGWGITLAFNIGPDTAAILSDLVGQPMVTILLNSFGNFIILTVYLVTVLRQTFALSYGALPSSHYLYKINHTTETPVNCIIFCTFCTMLLGLLTFAGPVAITAIFSMGVMCQYISYSLLIAARFFGGSTFVPGPFYMGKLSAPVAYVALLFMAFMVLVLLFPTNPGPTSADMNYSVMVVGGIISLCLTYYFFPVYGGRYWFTGPVKTTCSTDSKPDSLYEKEMNAD